MSTPGRPAQDLNWLITNFVERVPDVAHAVVVSSDGLPLAFSAGFPQERADQLAAVTSGLTSLTQGASRVFEGGAVVQTVVEMQRGVLVIMAISNGSSLAVLAASTCDLGLVAYEMTLLVERAGRVLTPATRSVMQAAEFKALALPYKFLGWDPPEIGRPPTLGEHTAQILSSLNYSQEEIEKLREKRAI